MSEAAPVGARGAPPRWVTPYLPRFQEILHALSLADGFVLMPVEVPSEDVAHALAGWLTAQGRPVVLVEPTTEEAWRGLTQALFEAKPGAEGVVMVIGPRGEPPRMMWGLGLLNQRRDSMGKHLGCPLLWCGPWAFLDATWRAAPDFWSVADVPKRLDAPGRAPPPFPAEWTDEEIADRPDDLMRIFRKIPRNRRRDAYAVALRAVRGYAAQSDFASAREVLQLKKTNRSNTTDYFAASHDTLSLRLDLCNFWKRHSDHLFDLSRLKDEYESMHDRLGAAEIMLLQGEVHGMSGDYPAAMSAYNDAIEVFRAYSGRFYEAQCMRGMGHILVRAGEPELAAAAYDAAVSIFRRFSNRRGEAHVLRGLGDLRLITDRFTEARQLYEQALALYRDLGDRLGEANAQQSLGALFFLLEDLDGADAAYREALRLYREIGIPEGERVTAERLSAVAGEKVDPWGA